MGSEAVKAGTITPGKKDSARVVDLPAPMPAPDEVLMQVLEVGIDGTDIEINRGEYGEAPSGQDFMIAGHEALGRVVAASGGFQKDDLVTLVVRRPDDCVNCQRGQMDMCVGGRYRECGIKGANGYLCELVTARPELLVKVEPALRVVAVLTEPTSIATKGIEEAFEFHRRVANPIDRTLVLGAGPLGLLATAIVRLHGCDAWNLDIVPAASPKAILVRDLGATYLDGRQSPVASLPKQIGNLDLIIEATGNSSVAFQAMGALGTNGVLCLMGVSTGEKPLTINADSLDIELVLGNKVVFGSVNSNRHHFERALHFLGQIESRWPGWLGRLITHRLPLDRFSEGLNPSPGNIKSVIELVPEGRP